MKPTILKIADKSNRWFSGDRAFFDSDQFPWVHSVESCAQDLIRVYNAFCKNAGKSDSMREISGGKNAVTKIHDWQVVSLMFYGSPVANDRRS